MGQCPPEILERAKKNLKEHFKVVGLLERFDESPILFKRAFGWRFPFHSRGNVTKARPSKMAISKDALRVIEKYNELDIELYRYGKEMFEEQVSKQPSLEKEVKVFRFLNRLMVIFYTPCRPVIKKIKEATSVFK